MIQEIAMVGSSGKGLRLALLGGAAGALLFAVPVLAQDYGPPPPDEGAYAAGPSEEVIITAPRLRFREEQGSGPRSLDLPPEKVSLSKVVSYRDLDLTTEDGGDRLRARVVGAAHHVCAQLRDAYPFEQLSTARRCDREAVDNALLRADGAIAAARQVPFYYEYSTHAYYEY
jgi:UrcA family protein